MIEDNSHLQQKNEMIHSDVHVGSNHQPLPHISVNFGQAHKTKENTPPVDSTRNLSTAQSTMKKELPRTDPSVGLSLPPPVANSHNLKPHGRVKKMKKSIFVSYSPDAGFLERKFVVETIKQLKENNLMEDIWFDKDEQNTDSPCWFSSRMEAVERCRGAILFLSDSYFVCPVSVYEGKTLIERQKRDMNSVKIYPVLYNLSDDTEIPKSFSHLLKKSVDLTREHAKSSLAEKTSVVIGSLMVDLEQVACIHAGPGTVTPPYLELTGEYRKKKICQWNINDLQEWLFRLGIKEFYRQSLAEFMVDGFLLMSLTDQDMVHHLGIDSRAVRKKLMQQILVTLDKEHRLPDNWHLRARTQRPKGNTVYLVYDPADVRLAQSLKMDLSKKGLSVLNHSKLGQSKEEFLQMNGPQMAIATFVIIILTESSTNSPFVFHEILFADWLGKRLVTTVFKNTWHSLRPSLRAVLGECPSIDFESKMYYESLDILEHHIKPLRTIPGVVLEQAYLNKMADGLKPLSSLTSSNAMPELNSMEQHPRIFISYQWDMHARIEEIRKALENNSFVCWSDISPNMPLQQRGHSGLSSQSGHSLEVSSETTQGKIQRNMRAAAVMLCCITPKYLQSDNCIKDLMLAETLHKPILPVMLRFCPWPPEGAPVQVRKILIRHTPVDLSNDKLFKQNINVLVDRIKKLISYR